MQTRNHIISQQRLPTHQANRILETLMRLFWLTRSQDTREVRDMMYFSRQEPMSMVRRSSSKQKRRE